MAFCARDAEGTDGKGVTPLSLFKKPRDEPASSRFQMFPVIHYSRYSCVCSDHIFGCTVLL